MTGDDLIGLCAAGEAAWQAAAYQGLGFPWRRDGDLAWAPAAVPHRYLLGAVTLTPLPKLPLSLVAGRSGVLCDSWAVLTARDLPGWKSSPGDPWMVREPGPCAVQSVPRVSVERTVDALLFEDTAFRAAGDSPPRRPGELHPAGSNETKGLHLLLARLDGAAVGTALVLQHDRGIVVSAVNVLREKRGRGIGSMLTAAAVNVAPGVPATLSASQLGLSLYRELGFRELASPAHWRPEHRAQWSSPP